MQLDPTQTSKVADYLGHDVVIHKKVYQQRAKADILNMSKILLKAQDSHDSRNDSKGSVEMDSTNDQDISINKGTDDLINSSDNESGCENNASEESAYDLTIDYLPQSHTTRKDNSNDLIKPKKIIRSRWSKKKNLISVSILLSI
ncbi:uncharacterized protein LOC141533048 [Cotesia typhae]|uniref:uncharacterized protein LOC141533048 n=1 Tax=Cotesia typhae TaxID=2053667 RepID=UPI003D69E35E